MKRVDPELKAFKTDIVAVFYEEITFRANKYQRFCWLGKNGQVLKPKITGRGLMVSELVCPCHVSTVDPDIEKYCCVILNYGNNYDVYWTRENVAIQLQDTHINFINTHPGCLPLYVFKN